MYTATHDPHPGLVDPEFEQSTLEPWVVTSIIEERVCQHRIPFPPNVIMEVQRDVRLPMLGEGDGHIRWQRQIWRCYIEDVNHVARTATFIGVHRIDYEVEPTLDMSR